MTFDRSFPLSLREHFRSDPTPSQALIHPLLRDDAPVPKSLDDLEVLIPRWKEILHYDEASGKMLWKQKLGQMFTKLEATFPTGRGGAHLAVRVDRLQTAAARVVWLFHHGEWPKERLVYKDGDPHNIRIENLAERDRRSAGVARSGNRWQAYARTGGRQVHLGYFETEREAREARKAFDEGKNGVRTRRRQRRVKGERYSRIEQIGDFRWKVVGYVGGYARMTHLGTASSNLEAEGIARIWFESGDRCVRSRGSHIGLPQGLWFDRQHWWSTPDPYAHSRQVLGPFDTARQALEAQREAIAMKSDAAYAAGLDLF